MLVYIFILCAILLWGLPPRCFRAPGSLGRTQPELVGDRRRYPRVMVGLIPSCRKVGRLPSCCSKNSLFLFSSGIPPPPQAGIFHTIITTIIIKIIVLPEYVTASLKVDGWLVIVLYCPNARALSIISRRSMPVLSKRVEVLAFSDTPTILTFTRLSTNVLVSFKIAETSKGISTNVWIVRFVMISRVATNLTESERATHPAGKVRMPEPFISRFTSAALLQLTTIFSCPLAEKTHGLLKRAQKVVSNSIIFISHWEKFWIWIFAANFTSHPARSLRIRSGSVSAYVVFV